MSPWGRAQRSEESRSSPFRCVIALGSGYVKALVVEIREGQCLVLGSGQVDCRAAYSEAGQVSDFHRLTAACEGALSRAEDMSREVHGRKVVADLAVLGVPGHWVKTDVCTIRRRRSKPASYVSERELEEMVERVQRLALRRISGEMSLSEGQACLLHASIAEISVDGKRVNDPFPFRGAELSLTVSNAFAPVTYLEQLHSLAEELEVEPLAVLAQPYALVRSLRAGEALCLDVGQHWLDVTLSRNGTVLMTTSIPAGGGYFTRWIASSFDISPGEAEKFKLDYSRGWMDEATRTTLSEALSTGSQVWVSQILAALRSMSAFAPFPHRLYLCGGGSLLPTLEGALRSFPWMEYLPFQRVPEVASLSPIDIPEVLDQTGTLADGQSVPLLTLAGEALPARGRNGPLENLLRKVSSRQMNVYLRGSPD